MALPVRVRPDPSLDRTATGIALGPLPRVVHHPSSGPSVIPALARSAQTLGVMKLVVDSNRLRDEALAAFLRSSRSNVAILADYAAMEALKGDPIVGMFESMKVLACFPAQVQILETTLVACGLSGASRGLQRRLVNVPLTREFGLFCRNLTQARFGSTPLAAQLRALGSEAQAHMARIEDDARGFAELSVEVARIFSSEERTQIVGSRPLPGALHHKLVLHVMALSAVIFASHPSVKRLPRGEDLVNTYIFRSSLCHLLLGFKYASVGGVQGKASHKIRNDMVDSHFATYGTYFDGVLSRDDLTNELYSLTSLVLQRFRGTNFA